MDKVVIIVSGSVVQEIFSTSKKIDSQIIDFDDLESQKDKNSDYAVVSNTLCKIY